jgi:uncharacterized membrane protein YdjX (TVP38/TMEM64 family)
MNKSKEKLKISFGILIIIIGIIGIVIFAKSTGILNFMNSVEAFKTYIEGYGNEAYIIFFIIQFMSVIIAPIPSNISAVAGGTIFGMWGSFFISMLAIITGSAVVFVLARKFGRAFTERFVSPKVSNKYEKLISSKKGELLLILLFLLPFLPDDAIGFLVGLSKMSFGRYFIIMMLTRPWEILAASALGSSNIIMPWWIWGVIAVIVLLLFKYGNKIEEKFISVFQY